MLSAGLISVAMWTFADIGSAKLMPEMGLVEGYVFLTALVSVSVGTLTQHLGRLADDRLREVCAALVVAVDRSLSSSDLH